jgi:putative Mg2+ transporter-C (MgtC) family protein
MACGAGLPILALVVTAGHFIVVFGFPLIATRLPRSRWTPSLLQVSYEDGRDILRDVLIVCTKQDFAVSRLQIERAATNGKQDTKDLTDLGASTSVNDPQMQAAQAGRVVTVALEVQGTGSVSKLASKLADIDGVVAVTAGDVNVVSES